MYDETHKYWRSFEEEIREIHTILDLFCFIFQRSLIGTRQ